jgi:hypothetical protein
MPWQLGSYSGGEATAFGIDSPIFVPRNVLESAVGARWTSTGTQTGTDITAASAPVYRAYDGRGSVPTFASGSLNTVYLNIQIPPSTIDTCMLLFSQTFPAADITIQLADAGSFGGLDNVVEFASWTSVTGANRLVRSFERSRYANVEFVRVRFVRNGGGTFSTLPRLSEFFLGQGRILSYRWEYGTDEQRSDAKVTEFEAKNGETARYVHYFGRRVVDHKQIYKTSSAIGLNDVSTIRTIFDESDDGTKPVIYIPHPNTAPTTAYMGFVEAGLDLRHIIFGGHEWEFSFKEQPPFQSRE